MPVQVTGEPVLIDHSKDQFGLFHIVHCHVEGEDIHRQNIIFYHLVHQWGPILNHGGVGQSYNTIILRIEDLTFRNDTHSGICHHNFLISFTDPDCVVGEVAT